MTELTNRDAACLLTLFTVIGISIGFFIGYFKGYREAKREHR